MKKIFFPLLAILLFGCQPPEKNESKFWMAQLELDQKDPNLIIPFSIEEIGEDSLIIRNAEEAILVTDIVDNGDSMVVTMPVFGSQFKMVQNGNTYSGRWHNRNKENYSIPFSAKKGDYPRFEMAEAPTVDFSGKYKVTFYDEEGNETKAIGIFQQDGQDATGTFLTETGDYRYLEGNVGGNEMKLSTFDGAHAFVFTAVAGRDGNLVGTFRSGKHWYEDWIGEKDDSASLTSADELTYLLPGFQTVNFEFPDTDGKLIKFPDEAYRGKVVLLQIFGTWCPNCMDESRYYAELYQKYHDQGLEIISLDFEPKPTMEYFKPRAERFKKDIGVEWPVVLAGPADKKEAVKSLPMLNHILSYPTTIFVAKDGSIRKIHTGFSGPGTGEAYIKFVDSTNKLVEKMVNE